MSVYYFLAQEDSEVVGRGRLLQVFNWRLAAEQKAKVGKRMASIVKARRSLDSETVFS